MCSGPLKETVTKKIEQRRNWHSLVVPDPAIQALTGQWFSLLHYVAETLVNIWTSGLCCKAKRVSKCGFEQFSHQLVLACWSAAVAITKFSLSFLCASSPESTNTVTVEFDAGSDVVSI